MSKPINLRQFRKRKAREDKARQAEQNRISHGTPKSLTDLSKARAEKAARDIEAKKLERSGDSTGDDADDGGNGEN